MTLEQIRVLIELSRIEIIVITWNGRKFVQY